MKERFQGSTLFFFTLIAIFCIILASVTQQIGLRLNHDVSWLLYVAKGVLESGGLYESYMENNPPLIVWLYMLPSLCAQYFDISLIVSFRIFVYILAILSAVIGLVTLKRSHLSKLFQFVISLFILAFFYGVLLNVEGNFGQREHLLVLLLFPYFIDSYTRTNSYKKPILQCIIIGIFAGLAISIKPYYVFIVAFTELFWAFHLKRWKLLFRETNIAFILTGVVYISLTYILHPEYFSFVIPLIANIHFGYWGNDSFINLLLMNFNIIDVPIILLVGILFATYSAANRAAILWPIFAIIGAYIGFLLSGTTWEYHLIPLNSLVFVYLPIALLLLAISSIDQFNSNQYKVARGSLFLLIIMLILLKVNFNATKFIWGYTAIAFVLFLMSIELKADLKKRVTNYMIVVHTLFAFSICGLTNIYHTSMVVIQSLYNIQLLNFQSKSELALKNDKNSRYPQQGASNILNVILDYTEHEDTIFFFSTRLYYFSDVLKSNRKWGSRFSHLWILPALVNKTQRAKLTDQRQLNRIEVYFKNTLIEDLEISKPKLIFVDVSEQKKYYESEFDYLEYFKQETRFQEFLKNYDIQPMNQPTGGWSVYILLVRK